MCTTTQLTSCATHLATGTQTVPVHHAEAYGELVGLERELAQQALDLLSTAITSGKLVAPYVGVDKRHKGSALNYDLYDIALGSRGQVVAALFQQRYTVCTKYGNSPSKEYVLIRRQRGKTVQIQMLDDTLKRQVMRRARQAKVSGEVIEVVSRNFI